MATGLPQLPTISETFPDEWNERFIVKNPKIGDLRDYNNWRGICVLQAIAKIIAKNILQRLKIHIYATIDAAEAGFDQSLPLWTTSTQSE